MTNIICHFVSLLPICVSPTFHLIVIHLISHLPVFFFHLLSISNKSLICQWPLLQYPVVHPLTNIFGTPPLAGFSTNTEDAIETGILTSKVRTEIVQSLSASLLVFTMQAHRNLSNSKGWPWLFRLCKLVTISLHYIWQETIAVVSCLGISVWCIHVAVQSTCIQSKFFITFLQSSWKNFRDRFEILRWLIREYRIWTRAFK